MLLNRRRFLKMSAGTIAAVVIAEKTHPGPTGAFAEEDAGTILTFDQERYPETLVRDPGIELKRDPARLLLAFDKQLPNKMVQSACASAGLVLEDFDDATGKKLFKAFGTINHNGRRKWVRSRDGQPITQVSIRQLNQVLQSSSASVEWIGGVYRFPNTEGRRGLLCPLPYALHNNPATRFHPSSDSEKAFVKKLDGFGFRELPALSRYSGEYRYFVLRKPLGQTVYKLRQLLETEKAFIREMRFENLLMLTASTSPFPDDPPDDQEYKSGASGQWNMRKIQAGSDSAATPHGWTISTGDPNVVVWVLDHGGVAVDHEDLQLFNEGIVLSSMTPIDSITDIYSKFAGDHATKCAGVVAAKINNVLGVAGLAGQCRIYPLAGSGSPTDGELQRAFHFAAEQAVALQPSGVSARVLTTSLGYGWNSSLNRPVGVDNALIDPAITCAFGANFVICAATGDAFTLNEGGGVNYPARNPLVIACGASDDTDARVSTAKYGWGSIYGPEISVVAPGIRIPTTTLPASLGGPDYVQNFSGTSASTPHVAGLAALLISKYPALTNVQVRNIIERSADYIPSAIAPTVITPNGNWNEETGYGRINVLKALNPADVMIKDWSGDTGVEPSTPPGGDFWDSSDIVTRPADDDVFLPDDILQSRRVVRGRDNYLYVQVTNNGPMEARNVAVNVRIVRYVSVQFVYPSDWTATDLTHVSPTPVAAVFPAIPAGGAVIAKFKISSAQVDTLWGWGSGMNWHPCILAEVTSDNDYAFTNAATTGGNLLVWRNNLAQSNLSVIEVQAGATTTFSILAGHRRNDESVMDIVVERSSLPPEGPVPSLWLDESEDIPPGIELLPGLGRISRIGQVSAEGGTVFTQGEKRYVKIREPRTIIRMQKGPQRLYLFVLKATIPLNAERGRRYTLKVSQRDQAGKTVGGATVVYVVV